MIERARLEFSPLGKGLKERNINNCGSRSRRKANERN